MPYGVYGLDKCVNYAHGSGQAYRCDSDHSEALMDGVSQLAIRLCSREPALGVVRRDVNACRLVGTVCFFWRSLEPFMELEDGGSAD